MLSANKLASLFVICWVIFPLAAYYPSGMYVTFREDGLSQIGAVFTERIVDHTNHDTNLPQVAGETSKVKYVFKEWAVNIALANIRWMNNTSGSNNFFLQWDNFAFTINFKYHMCLRDWPNPCEDGKVTIYTTNNNPKLLVNMYFNFDTPNPVLDDTQVDLIFSTGDIKIHVDCTSTVCVIPPSQIADAIAQDFTTTFERSVQNSVHKQATEIAQTLKVFRTIPIDIKTASALVMDLEGGWHIIPSASATPGLVLIPTGAFYSDVNGVIKKPPFSPTFSVPTDVLQSPRQRINIHLTQYLFNTMFWAMAEDMVFNRVFRDADLPAESPVRLTTNDDFFQSVAPGLTEYPNMEITVETKLTAPPTASVDARGLHLSTPMVAYFSLSNSSYSHHGFVLMMTHTMDMPLTATLYGAGVMINETIANFNSTIQVTNTAVGDIDTNGFVQLFQLLSGAIKLPGFLVNLPTGFAASSPTVTATDNYLTVGIDYSYSLSNHNSQANIIQS